MRLVILSVGRLKQGAERELVERYRERAAAIGRGLGVTQVEIAEIPESRSRREAARRAEEADAIRRAVGSRFSVFDESGPSRSSADFAARIRRDLDGGATQTTLVIGGPDGLDAALRGEAEAVFSFGAFTLPHQIVRVLVAEQVYRAFTILAGHPYHRAGSSEA